MAQLQIRGSGDVAKMSNRLFCLILNDFSIDFDLPNDGIIKKINKNNPLKNSKIYHAISGGKLFEYSTK
ncbi:hypothetical protein MK079_01805 [Candidatus Gracilibacteria bacterium]|nr:hypothetical protein [Candidatus Gracilibacteria bacterium]